MNLPNKKQVVALHRYVRISPSKARYLMPALKNKTVEEALQVLNAQSSKASGLIAKVLRSVLANAEHNHGIPSSDLKIVSVTADKAAIFRRSRPVARGSAHPIKKQTSHIKVIASN